MAAGHKTVNDAIDAIIREDSSPVRTPLATVSEIIAKEKPTLGADELVSIRTFASGANRDTDSGKLDYEGFIDPTVFRRFAEYMHKNRYMRDGSIRASDNWQAGFPRAQTMKSLIRHTWEQWMDWRTLQQLNEEALCAIIFNAQALLRESLLDRSIPE